LQQKLAEALRTDYADKWNADANKVASRVNAAAEDVAHYREWADQIVAVLVAAEAVNKDVDRINGSAADGEMRRLAKVDLAWAKNLLLPEFQHPDRKPLWPPPQPSLAAIYTGGMGVAAHPGADWASDEWQRRRVDAVRAEQNRQASFYETSTEAQEERQNTEERQRFSRRQP
jgi:hypothetical protein